MPHPQTKTNGKGGWFGETNRHRQAALTGHAGGQYASDMRSHRIQQSVVEESMYKRELARKHGVVPSKISRQNRRIVESKIFGKSTRLEQDRGRIAVLRSKTSSKEFIDKTKSGDLMFDARISNERYPMNDRDARILKRKIDDHIVKEGKQYERDAIQSFYQAKVKSQDAILHKGNLESYLQISKKSAELRKTSPRYKNTTPTNATNLKLLDGYVKEHRSLDQWSESLDEHQDMEKIDRELEITDDDMIVKNPRSLFEGLI